MSNRIPSLHVARGRVCETEKVWIAPSLLAAVFTAVMATVYFGSVIDPTGHLHGLPVMIVDQDTRSGPSAS
jgi:uncharacterized phage infection (PIP) family protein YhgE